MVTYVIWWNRAIVWTNAPIVYVQPINHIAKLDETTILLEKANESLPSTHKQDRWFSGNVMLKQIIINIKYKQLDKRAQKR